MHLSKKAKITLLTAIPAVAIATSVSVVTPIVLISELDALSVLNSATDIAPVLSTENINKNVQNLPFNPTQFSARFFVDKIANQPSMKNPNINTNHYLFAWDGTSENGVKYDINYVGLSADNSEVVEANITKSYKGKSAEYTIPIKYYRNGYLVQSSDFFSNLNQSEEVQNFLQQTSLRFKSFFKNGIAKVNVVNATSFELNQIRQDQLKLISTTEELAFNPENTGYVIPSKMFEFNQESVNFEFVVTSDSSGKPTIWTAEEAWPVDVDGNFDQTKSLAFSYLRSILPPKITDQKIQEIIFNSKYDSPTDSSKPVPGCCALLVKLTVGSESFYTIIWQDIFQSASDNIFETAPKVNYRVKQGMYPTADEIQANPNKYLEMTALPGVGLQYNIQTVTIPLENNEDRTRIVLTVKIQSLTSPELEPKIYEVEISSGIMGKKQSDFDNEIRKILSGSTNGELTPLIPTVALAGLTGTTLGEKVSELNGLLPNPTEFDKKAIVNNTHASIVKYVPIFVDSISDKILICYEIVSATDPNIKSTVVPSITVEIANTTSTTP